MAVRKQPTASARVRDAIGKLARPVTPAEISAYLGGQHLVDNLSSLLGNMAAKGLLVRHGSGKSSRYVLGRPPGPPRRTVAAAMTGIARNRATPRTTDPALRPKTTVTRERDCSLAGIPSASTAARERIAADIAAFEASGGKIERLGPTQFFRRAALSMHASPNAMHASNDDLIDDEDD